MAIRYPEIIGSAMNDAFYATGYAVMLGLQGADDFGGGSAMIIGGSGNDLYYLGLPGLHTIADRSGTGDRLVVTEIGLARATTFALTIDSRHLFIVDSASQQGVVVVDWQLPASRIESVTLGSTVYTHDQFAAAVTSFARFEGDFTWEAAAAAGYFSLGPGEGTAEVNESLDFYRARAIALENPKFLATNTDAGTNDEFAAVAYAGPVFGIDLEFLSSEASEAILGTAFSDFINARGGNDAIDGGLGDDVIDGGIGSNFLSGGLGRDIFFLDGRGGTATWSTITDWEAGEQLSLWGWLPGISKSVWVASDGTAGFTGVTLHSDLNGDGVIETSVTWSGRSQGDLPTALEFDGLLWFV